MSVRSQAEDKLRQFQHDTGLQCGGPNLYPGTAARVVSEEWESLVRALIQTAEKPQDQWDWKDFQTIDIAKDALT